MCIQNNIIVRKHRRFYLCLCTYFHLRLNGTVDYTWSHRYMLLAGSNDLNIFLGGFFCYIVVDFILTHRYTKTSCSGWHTNSVLHCSVSSCLNITVELITCSLNVQSFYVWICWNNANSPTESTENAHKLWCPIAWRDRNAALY